MRKKNMKKLLLCNVFVLIMTCLCACSEGKTEAQVDAVRDTVSFATVGMNDTMTYSIIGTECEIKADVEISYPQKYVDNERTDAIQRLFAAEVLGVSGDSASLASAFPLYVKHLMSAYSENDREVEPDELESDFEPAQSCQLTVKIYNVYNKGGLMCICKEERVQINETLPEVQHSYYTFDLDRMSRKRMSDMFDEVKFSHIIALMKNKLREDMGVASDDELVDLGLYNLDNMSVVDNFYTTDDSIIWNYLPRELAVRDEVRIALSKETILISNE